MFALPGIIALIIFSLVRPFELFEELRGLPLLNAFCGLAVLGYLLDIRVGLSKPIVSKLVWLSLVWFGWVIVSVAISAPHTLGKSIGALLPAFLVFFLISSAIQTRRAFSKVVAVVLASVVWICLVCLQQAVQPAQCLDFLDLEHVMGTGITCEQHSNCWELGADMRCERMGWFGLHSVNQRVKYTGVLNDPNEVAMLASAAIPFAIALWKERPTRWRTFGLCALIATIVATVLATGSRGGLLVLMVVVASYTVQVLGLRRVLRLAPFILVLLVVALVFKGEGRADAEASSLKRLGCMITGIELLLGSPVFGVGYGQFTQYHDQTAHSAYILAASELGFGGLVLWGTVMYLSVTSAFRVGMLGEANKEFKNWGLAMATSLVGVMTGIFFLSFTYHLILWLILGLIGALNTLLPTTQRLACMRISAAELGGVVLALFLMLVSIYYYAASNLDY